MGTNKYWLLWTDDLTTTSQSLVTWDTVTKISSSINTTIITGSTEQFSKNVWYSVQDTTISSSIYDSSSYEMYAYITATPTVFSQLNVNPVGNTFTSYTATCPVGLSGSAITINVEPNTYFAQDLTTANQLAINYAIVTAYSQLTCFTQSIDPIVAQLFGLSWQMPCLSTIDSQACTVALEVYSSASIVAPSGSVYSASIRVRGVIEQRTYPDGVNEGFWNIGGSWNGGDPFNVYQLTVTSPNIPLQTYYLNSGTSFIQESFAVDYTSSIQVENGSFLEMTAYSIDTAAIANNSNLSVADDDSLRPVVVSQPYNGQFMQIDALSLTPA